MPLRRVPSSDRVPANRAAEAGTEKPTSCARRENPATGMPTAPRSGESKVTIVPRSVVATRSARRRLTPLRATTPCHRPSSPSTTDRAGGRPRRKVSGIFPPCVKTPDHVACVDRNHYVATSFLLPGGFQFAEPHLANKRAAHGFRPQLRQRPAWRLARVIELLRSEHDRGIHPHGPARRNPRRRDRDEPQRHDRRCL
jgi:hypothetical protein